MALANLDFRLCSDVGWASKKFSSAIFFLYEQIHPYDAFGEQMIRNLELLKSAAILHPGLDICDSKTERALIEKLASIRVSSREHTIQTDDDTNVNRIREKRKLFSMKEETSSSIWDSVKNYLRRRPPSERFTSLTCNHRYHCRNSVDTFLLSLCGLWHSFSHVFLPLLSPK